MIIFARTQQGQELAVPIADLVARAPALSAARVVPPLAVVNEYLSRGEGRYDHWRSIKWNSIELTLTQFEELRWLLMEKFEMKALVPIDAQMSMIEWEARQLHWQTGRAFDELLSLVRHRDALNRSIDLLIEFDDSDVLELLNLKRAEVTAQLQ